MNNVAILNCLYNYIYKNKQGVGNRIHVPNTKTSYNLEVIGGLANTDPFSYYRPHKIIVV